MTAARLAHERSYRTLLLLYPRRFRREFGGDMVQLLRDDLDQRGALRGWARALLDLSVSVPVQHLEATMAQTSNSRSAQARLAIAVLAVLAVFSVGRYVILVVPITAVVAITALLYWRSQVPYREAVAEASSSWWRIVAAGAALLLGINLTANYGPTVDWFPWHLAALLFLMAWALMLAGTLLGLVHLARRLRRPAGSFGS